MALLPSTEKKLVEIAQKTSLSISEISNSMDGLSLAISEKANPSLSEALIIASQNIREGLIEVANAITNFR